MKKLFIIVLLFLLLVFSGFALFHKQTKSLNPKVEPSPTVSVVTTQLFEQLPKWNSSIKWNEPTNGSQTTSYGIVSGVARSGKVTTQVASLPHFEDETFLQNLGFHPDISLSADGPGSSVWGYKKVVNNKSQIILFSYHTQPTSTAANEPIQFTCPCTTNVSVFISNP